MKKYYSFVFIFALAVMIIPKNAIASKEEAPAVEYTEMIDLRLVGLSAGFKGEYDVDEAVYTLTEEYKQSTASKSYSDSDIEQLAGILMHEVGYSNISDYEIYMTGSVVINRINSTYFPNDMYSVLNQAGQYCSYNEYMNSVQNRGLNQSEINRCYRIAEDLLENGSIAPANVLYCSMNPLGTGVYWKSSTQYFCYK